MVTADREVVVWPGNVRCYSPTRPSGYYRIVWRDPAGKRRETTAITYTDAMERASALSKAMTSGAVRSTATFGELLDAYEEHVVPDQHPRDAEASRTALRRIRRYPHLLATPCARLTRSSFAPAFRDARAELAYSSRASFRRRLVHVLSWGRAEDWVPHDRDPLLKANLGTPPVREHGEGQWRAVRDDEVPTHDAVHQVAKAIAHVTKLWWTELMVLLAAYSGLRWGELIGLTGSDVVWPDHPDPDTRSTIRVQRQVIEASGQLSTTPPKGHKARNAIWPPKTPGGVDLEALLRRRVDEVGDAGLLFPAPRGGYMRRSNFNRRWWSRARSTVPAWRGWVWHDLRHVYCTWLLNDVGLAPSDAILFTGHETTQILHARYVGTRPRGAAAEALAAIQRAS